MNSLNLSSERKNYLRGSLLETETPDTPYPLFEKWMAEALLQKLEDATAMSLATSRNDRPSSRIVLLKGVDNGGFTFFSNYASRKGQELEQNPHVAANFFWASLERQVRIEGVVERISRTASEAYFMSRPLESQISAAASPQSQKLADRAALETLWKNKLDELGGSAPPLPPYWGGYSLLPTYIEFWQGGAGRLHDRIVYEKADSEWVKYRLAP